MSFDVKQFLEEQFQTYKASFDQFVTKSDDQLAKMRDDLKFLTLKVEGSSYTGGGAGKSIGEEITHHAHFKAFHDGGFRRSEKIRLKSYFPEQKQLTSDGSAGALVVPTRAA